MTHATSEVRVRMPKNITHSLMDIAGFRRSYGISAMRFLNSCSVRAAIDVVLTLP